jgi:ribosomal protein S18 acetylase RimI-like enzyme
VLRVSAAHEVTDELTDALCRLVPQLSSSTRSPSAAELDQVVTSPATTLLVARDDELDPGPGGLQAVADAERADGPIVGILTLVAFRIPTGVRAWVEDVVVDAEARGRGVGEALVQAALELAAARGAKTVDLTSRPSREAANRLYQRMGFERRETNVYRRKLEASPATEAGPSA